MNASSIQQIDSDFRGALRLRLGQIGLVMLSLIAVIRFGAGQVEVALLDLGWAAFLGLALLWMRGGTRNSDRLGMVMAAVSMAATMAKVHFLGANGIAWLYPVALGVFAVTELRPAAWISGIGVAHAALYTVGTGDFEQVATTSMSLLLVYAVALVSTAHVRRLRTALEVLASRDALTQVGNRRALDHRLGGLLRESAPTAVALLDLDRFKAINDRFGHATGDQVLTEFAALVRATVRPADRLYRYGGEEFVLLMPGTDAAEALGVGERINARTREALRAQGAGVTVSVGVAVAVAGEDAQSLLARADTALYAAKSAGRDRVELAP